jgi:hypothetical protein
MEFSRILKFKHLNAQSSQMLDIISESKKFVSVLAVGPLMVFKFFYFTTPGIFINIF